MLACLTVLLTAAAQAADSPFAKIDVYPPDIKLETSRDLQRFIVVGAYPDGVTVGLTDNAEVSLADTKLAKLDGSTLYRLADGLTSLKVAVAGHEAQVPVTVTKAGEDRPISFKLDMMPVFMRAGCNT